MSLRTALDGHWKAIAYGAGGLAAVFFGFGVERTFAEIADVRRGSDACCAKTEAVQSEVDKRTRDVESLRKIEEALPKIHSGVQAGNVKADSAEREATRARVKAEEMQDDVTAIRIEMATLIEQMRFLVRSEAGIEAGPPPGL